MATATSELAPVLERASLRPTRRRVEVLSALAASSKPVTAQALHAKLARKASAPGLATVYRTLQALADAGLVRTFPAGEGELSYRLCDPEHHHHLICERCGRVEEIPSCEMEGWATRVAKPRGFTVVTHQADIFGVCATCSQA